MTADDESDRPVDAVGTSGRQALRDLRILCAVAAVTLGGVAVAVLLHAGRTTDLDAVEAASDALAAVHDHEADATLLLHQWVAEPNRTSSAASELGSAAMVARAEADRAWQRFLERAATVPGQQELIEGYSDAVAASERWLDEQQGRTGVSPEERLARMAAVAESTPASLARLDAVSELRARYADAQVRALRDERRSTSKLKTDVSVAVASGFGVLLLGFLVLGQRGRRRAAMLRRVDALLRSESERTTLEGQLNRALEMSDEEAAAYRVLEAALREVLGDATASELLVADASFAHLAQVAHSREPEVVGCEVATPAECPAVRRGHTQHFPSPTALDACPHLRDRGTELATTCVPFTVGGTSVGVLHVEAPASLPEESVALVELVSRKTGDRVGVARAFAKSEDQARTDPLTGLLNRRSLEERGRQVAESGQPFTVVFADLDHFKTLNDVHGHDAGDRALRLFARALREAVRPTDVIGRYGGEEFVFVLPHCEISGATAVIERLRAAVDRSLDSGSVPRFTASFGMAECTSGPLADAIAKADAALLSAKRAGRNRSIAWSPDLGSGRIEAADTVPTAASDTATPPVTPAERSSTS